MRFFMAIFISLLFNAVIAQEQNTENQSITNIQTDNVRSYEALQFLPLYNTPPFDNNRIKSLRIHTEKIFPDYLFNRPLWQTQGKNYALALYPLLWNEAGKSNRTSRFIFINSRGLGISGRLGKHVFFGTEVFENQARFPALIDSIISSKHTGQGFPGIVPGFGIAKNHRNGIFDFPSGRAYVEYRPSAVFRFRIAHGNPYIGYGHRSLLVGNHLPPFPYFAVEARFWHIRYTTFWAELQDVRAGIMPKNYYYKKYMAVHYLDWAVYPRWNLGLFEAVIWDPGNGRGFDVNFINPVIFFKTAEFQSGTKSANTLLGLNTRIKLPLHWQAYAQFLLDEMTVSKFFGQPGYWGNKFAVQTGLRFDFVRNNHLWHALIEWNWVRPYTYSHHLTTINYAHDNWPIAHPWGANLREIYAEISWQYKRFRTNMAFSHGLQGLDFPDEEAGYGADIYRDYEERISDTDIFTLQGNLYKRTYFSLETGWIVNPVYRLEIYTGIRYFNRQIEKTLLPYHTISESWAFIGLRTKLFRYHFNL